MKLVIAFLVYTLFASVAFAQSSKPTEKPPVRSKALTASQKNPVEKRLIKPEPVRNVFQGEFEFKGLAIGKSKEETFSDPATGRIVLQEPSPNQIKGFLSLGTPKNIKSADFVNYACSKELGAAISNAYSSKLDRKVSDAKDDIDNELAEAKEFIRKYDRRPDMTRARNAIDNMRRYAEERESFKQALRASDSAFGECTDTIANRRVESIFLSFYKDHIGAITILFDAKDFDTILSGLTDKYGQPYGSDKTQLSLKLTGAPANFVSVQWKDSKGRFLTVQNNEQDGSIFREKGIFSITDLEYEGFLSKEKELSGVIPASRDL